MKCMEDPVYFATKCQLMTPTGLKLVTLRDYQVDYLHHLQKNRFTIWLACRQAGKTLNLSTNIIIKNVKKPNLINKNCPDIRKINYFKIENDIYKLPMFEFINLYCKQTLIWKIKYHLYKIIYKLNNGR